MSVLKTGLFIKYIVKSNKIYYCFTIFIKLYQQYSSTLLMCEEIISVCD